MGSVDHVGVITELTITAFASMDLVTGELTVGLVTTGVTVDTSVTLVTGASGGVVTLGCMWMMGGLLGLVGLGRVSGSQNTTPRDLEILMPFSGSVLSLHAKMEDWDTPVE